MAFFGLFLTMAVSLGLLGGAFENDMICEKEMNQEYLETAFSS
jgi:hypothetical protein